MMDKEKMVKQNLKDLELSKMGAYFEDMGEKRFRAEQVFSWLYCGARSFSEMTNLSKQLRERLAKEEALGRITLGCLDIERIQKSGIDGTRKYLFGLADGNRIESVFMKYQYGNSICISSQAGCRMGCRFCASALGGLSRNLTPGEMVDQIVSAQRDTGERINHVVVMGTGEPFDNYENLAAFLRIIKEPKGLGIGMRNITVSTCGLLPAIGRFAEEFPQVNLAISLHASNDSERTKLMPVNKRYPMNELLSACKNYTEKTGRRVTFEYTLVKGVNDSRKKAEELRRLLSGMLCHVNIIPLNRVEETGFFGAERRDAVRFMEILMAGGVPATIRRELGSDIDAACGQLRLQGK